MDGQQSLMNLIFLVLLTLFTISSADLIQGYSPSQIERTQTLWKWCNCGQGINSITIWPYHQSNRTINISTNSIKWIKFSDNVSHITWKCDGSNSTKKITLNLTTSSWLSILLYSETLQSPKKCNKTTGKISFNIWKPTSYISSIPFTSHTQGYACFKIPTLLKTAKGTLIAFSEARTPGCDDFDKTELVYKRSIDDGKTWSPISKLVSEQSNDEGECDHKLVIGNISPVQLSNTSKYPNRILAPYTRNNFKLWVTHSDDDGISWKGNQILEHVSQTESHPDCNRNMSYFGLNIDQLKLKNLPDIIRFIRMVCIMKNPFHLPDWTNKLKAPWQFIGVGPSRGIQLKNGRILIPGYHSPIRGLSGVKGALPISQLYNNFAKGFVLISDDGGESWRLGKEWPIGEGTNEHQLIQLDDGTIVSNSRSLSTGSPQYRLQSMSFTNGQTFTSSQFTSIPQPFGGCQGSTVGGKNGLVYVTSPNPKRGKSFLQYLIDALGCKINLNGREKLSLWVSRDNGKTYRINQIIDEGLSAQTSLHLSKGKLLLLYEQADPLPKTATGYLQNELIENLRVLLPSRFVFRELKVIDEV